jgi:hypothetical protein
MIAPLDPPPCDAAAVADASDGVVPADFTPDHRSLDALRVEPTGAVLLATALLLAFAVRLEVALAGAELLNTAWPPACVVTPAVEPLTRALTALCGARAGALGCAAGVAFATAFAVVLGSALWVVPDTLGGVADAAGVAGAAATGTASAAGAAAVGGVMTPVAGAPTIDDCGGVGEAGVP